MLALSIRQPWAEAFFHGKSIEVRRRMPAGRRPQPGETIYIHTGKLLVDNWEELAQSVQGEWEIQRKILKDIMRQTLVYGALIGTADYGGIIHYECEYDFRQCVQLHWNNPMWYDAPCVGLRLLKVKRLPSPIPWKGRLGFFEVDLKGSGA